MLSPQTTTSGRLAPFGTISKVTIAAMPIKRSSGVLLLHPSHPHSAIVAVLSRVSDGTPPHKQISDL